MFFVQMKHLIAQKRVFTWTVCFLKTKKKIVKSKIEQEAFVKRQNVIASSLSHHRSNQQ